jgi:hypothetical protein
MAHELKEPFWILVGNWQMLIAGILALIAAAGSIGVTKFTARREIWAARRQTDATRDQIAAMKLIERRRVARHSYTFFSMLDAAMEVVVEDVNAARETVAGELVGDESLGAYYARQRIKKTAFPELRNACLECGGKLTAPFLRLDKEIDEFATQLTYGYLPMVRDRMLMGINEGLLDQLDHIERHAFLLRDEARAGIGRCKTVFDEMPDLEDCLEA